jgi:hypothetical protein
MRGLAKLLLGVMLGIAGLGTIGFIGIRTGHITIILGDHNKVDNREQSDPKEPAKPIASTIKTELPVPQLSTPYRVEPAVEEIADQPSPVELAHARRKHSVPAYEPDDECSCPSESEPEPQPQQTLTRRVRTEPNRIVYPSWVSTSPTTSDYSHSSASSEAYVNGSRSVSVSTTTINGRLTQKRVIVNGQVIVDE